MSREYPRIDLTEDEVRLLAALIAADDDGEHPQISFLVGDGHSGRGLYVAYTEYPEEGVELIAALSQQKENEG